MIENIFDTHAHYADRAFDEDRSEVLAELPAKGVRLVMLASSGMRDSEENSRLSRQYGYIYSAAGIHPECVDEACDGYIGRLRGIIAGNPKIKAVGEIGLDYHYDNYDREKQINVFRQQLALAAELDMPVIIHSRDAFEDTMSILNEYRPKGVMHCFSGSAEIAREVVKLGMYIGFTGVITFKNAKKSVKALAEVPLDRLLMETDCPYMAPEPMRGRRCDSSMIAYTAAKAAEIKGITVQELADTTFRNGLEVYGIKL